MYQVGTCWLSSHSHEGVRTSSRSAPQGPGTSSISASSYNASSTSGHTSAASCDSSDRRCRTATCLSTSAPTSGCSHSARRGRSANSGRVLAIEPAPENLARLQVNAQLNPRSHITVMPVAIGASRGTIELGMPQSQAGIQNSGARSSMSSENQIEVDLTTIDDAVERWKPGRHMIDLVKLDVEGMENEVVCGGPDLFGYRANCVMLEVNHRYGDDDLAVESLRRLGYGIHRLGAFARLRPWKTGPGPKSCISSLARRLPAGVGPWITGEARLTTAIATRAGSGRSSTSP